MKRYIFILFSCLLLSATGSFAQSDAFTGTWLIEPAAGANNVHLELRIAAPERNLLYPAQLTLSCDSFSAVYDLLLVKKNSRQLSIGRNKAAVSETPFSLGSWTILLNGTLDLSKDNKGIPYLSVERIFAKKYGVPMPEISSFDARFKNTAATLNSFLKNAEIRLKKTDHTALENGHTDLILQPSLSGNYFGILDTVHVKTRDGILNFTGNKKSANGIVSVMLNGRAIFDQVYLSEKKPSEEIVLDTGLNILAFFAEDYGSSPANTGTLQATFGNKKFSMDFGTKKDVAATFIVAKIYYEAEADSTEDSSYQHHMVTQFLENKLQNDVTIYRYPDKDRKIVFKNDTVRALAENSLLRDAKVVGNIKARSSQILLAFWDDAVEDGDSISLSINGHWIVQGLAVKKKPQFIYVTLEQGPNIITFIADNLGSIIPNTSVLEIIDGKQRKSFMIDTDLSQNNLIKISYEYKPGR